MFSGSESDSGTPEAIGLSQSARAARGAARELEAFRAEQRQRIKEKNRARDARLKEHAAEKSLKGKGKDMGAEGAEDEEGEDGERERLEARMARAMGEAEGESGGDSDEAEGLEDVEMEEDEEGTGESEEDDEDAEMGEEFSGSEDDEDLEDERDVLDPKSKYLPDHLFTAALSNSRTSTKRTTNARTADADSRPIKKRKRATKKSKDILIGSRVIRALPSAGKVVEGTGAPSRRAARFTSKALALKGPQKTAKGWERRPTNLGVLKRSSGAPAMGHFEEPTRHTAQRTDKMMWDPQQQQEGGEYPPPPGPPPPDAGPSSIPFPMEMPPNMLHLVSLLAFTATLLVFLGHLPVYPGSLPAFHCTEYLYQQGIERMHCPAIQPNQLTLSLTLTLRVRTPHAIGRDTNLTIPTMNTAVPRLFLRLRRHRTFTATDIPNRSRSCLKTRTVMISAPVRAMVDITPHLTRTYRKSSYLHHQNVDTRRLRLLVYGNRSACATQIQFQVTPTGTMANRVVFSIIAPLLLTGVSRASCKSGAPRAKADIDQRVAEAEAGVGVGAEVAQAQAQAHTHAYAPTHTHAHGVEQARGHGHDHRMENDRGIERRREAARADNIRGMDWGRGLETFQHPQFLFSKCTGRKKALCIGINYAGQSRPLHGCVNDAKSVYRFLVKYYHYDPKNIILLTDDARNPRDQPTRANIFSAMRWLVKGAHAHDSLFFHYSGHGGQTRDKNGDEVDGYDEIIFPVDYQRAGDIVDDDLHHVMVRPLPPGCRLTAVFDSCHSGSVLDLPYMYHSNGRLKGSDVAPRYKKIKATPAEVICWSGCKDSGTTVDTQEGGLPVGAMSYAFLKVLKRNPNITYRDLLRGLKDVTKRYKQKAQLSAGHRIDTERRFLM
ncbi:hypothetical protein EVG20_g2131 [Dentipellis fragilis]|uniref:Peptidase C14 caspase domain-containing protein n=1 Tax=Dentipellis fragilis TaxID=205917 RepID=A0A4Y9ZBU8_9AGAM|nr:hypothetical protein EVG20_g2131 [Dentipellis fragilis]